jgi:hypothetical protein
LTRKTFQVSLRICVLPPDVPKSWTYFIALTRIHNVRKRMQDEARESGLLDCMIPADSIAVYAQVRVTRRNLFHFQMVRFTKRIPNCRGLYIEKYPPPPPGGGE